MELATGLLKQVLWLQDAEVNKINEE